MLGMIANPHSNKVMCQENRNSPDSPICFPEHMIPHDQGYNNIDFKALLNRPNLDGQGNSNIADHLKSSLQMETRGAYHLRRKTRNFVGIANGSLHPIWEGFRKYGLCFNVMKFFNPF